MVSIHPTDENIMAFWTWFQRIADELAESFESPRLLNELDAHVSQLGDVSWELGPGSHAENALAISPDGAADLLPLTRRIVSLAPQIPGWEFLPARPARVPHFTFSITSTSGQMIDVDAHKWRYVLYRFPDGSFDIVLEQVGLLPDSADDRYMAAVTFLDGLLGEASRLARIRDVEPVDALTVEQAQKANPVTVLRDHLDSLRPKN